MTTLDWIIVIVLGMGVMRGFMKGFVSQVVSIIGLIAGLLVARALFDIVGRWLATEVGTSITVGQILAFILIGIVVPLLLSVVASLLTKVLNSIHLGCFNRWLGAGAGLIKYALLVSMAINLIQFIDADNKLIQSTTKQQSVLYYPMKRFSGVFYPAVKSVAEQLIDDAPTFDDTDLL